MTAHDHDWQPTFEGDFRCGCGVAAPEGYDAAREARKARDRAMEAVDGAADPDWKAAADKAIIYVAERRAEFTTDPVWAVLEARGWRRRKEGRVMGPRMTVAGNLGIATRTDRVVSSKRVTRHGGPMAIWRSNIYRPAR